jgi:glycosyltransferase involved in cell wall biosynthesis
MVRRESRRKNAWIKVHTRRERRVVTEIFEFDKCFDYPLAFLNEEERRAAWTHTDRDAFKRKYGFVETDKLIGLFGYISEYKGIETAIRAMAELPDDYKLVIFGSHHPQSIQANTALHPYLASLIELIDDTAADRYAADLKIARLRRASAPQQISVGEVKEALPEPRMPLSERVIFAGNLPDPEFIEALRLVDAAVLPYIEVGQSMSGVVVLGLEAGARLICAQNHSFAEVKRYFGEVFTSFDMGNYIELAQRIRTFAEGDGEWDFPEARDQAFERFNIRASAREQLKRFGFQI